ncbi:ribonucleoside-diphosphate reductase class Ia beta subunit [Methylocaldum marinum]|uniref:Ribonucleoside-diphosphate reductase class Ia beta subunit n=1 Tax=Methylocaldum marinum TaxID=1432792 RepID=A0A250KTT1_9GAMM|nr:ribonucleoside-diphosphate reductase class Ia beta subunit [Methylocaldum marinum]
MGPFSVPVYAEEQLIEFATLAKFSTVQTRDPDFFELIRNGARYDVVIQQI